MSARPLYPLRFLSLSATILMAAVLIVMNTGLVRAPAWLDFMLGLAFGMSIGVQVQIWSSHLKWVDKPRDTQALRLDIG